MTFSDQTSNNMMEAVYKSLNLKEPICLYTEVEITVTKDTSNQALYNGAA